MIDGTDKDLAAFAARDARWRPGASLELGFVDADLVRLALARARDRFVDALAHERSRGDACRPHLVRSVESIIETANHLLADVVDDTDGRTRPDTMCERILAEVYR